MDLRNLKSIFAALPHPARCRAPMFGYERTQRPVLEAAAPARSSVCSRTQFQTVYVMATLHMQFSRILFRRSRVFMGAFRIISLFLCTVFMDANAVAVFDSPQLRRAASLDKPQLDLEASEEVQASRVSAAPPLIAGILNTDPSKSDAELRAPVWAFLRQAWKYDPAQEGEWLLGVDEALHWLRCGAVSAASVSEVENGLVNLVADTSLPEAEREFALLHLGGCNLSAQGTALVVKLLSNVMEGDVTRPLCGAALIAIAEINPDDTHLWALARKCALQMAASPAAHVRNRISAFEVVAAKGWVEVEPVICERLCITRNVAERVSAFDALGSIGSADTLHWIETLPTENDAVCAAARDKSMQAVMSRLANAPGVESNPN